MPRLMTIITIFGKIPHLLCRIVKKLSLGDSWSRSYQQTSVNYIGVILMTKQIVIIGFCVDTQYCTPWFFSLVTL